ncbi:MAG TPA: methylated-DNA--[protein]-cysteine S-methyltransferase [Longimicrobiales bacterium]|nr:methylated-DNA--[protein]-cysteine S-methyltransferase [Longimicrobiales bacterium]
MSDFATQVYGVVRKCPRGKIVSYGGVAAMLGQPRSARAVGRALNALPDDTDIPWWRVVNSRGEVSIRGVEQGESLQRSLLEREGVKFDGAGRISWKRFGWEGE